MTIFNFNQLSPSEQLASINADGVFLAYRLKTIYLVRLYQINHFFVETYYHIEDETMDSMHGFTDTERLSPYLKKIKVPF